MVAGVGGRQEEGGDSSNQGEVEARLLGGLIVPVFGGSLTQSFPKAGALTGAMGAGCPSCLPPSLCSTQSGQEGC